MVGVVDGFGDGCGIPRPNDYLRSKILLPIISTTTTNGYDSIDPRTELDSHANMVVLGRNCFVFDSVQGRHCDVQPFDPSIGCAKKVPIVDGAIAYDCPISHKTYLLIVRNALHIPSMDNNLIPPFIMREAGISVNDTPKIHVQDPSCDDHSIYFKDSGLRIPLKLWGIFSYFHSRVPTDQEIAECDKVFITPDSDSWDPYSDHFASNEDSLLDYNGDVIDDRRRKRHRLDDYSDVLPSSIYESYVDSVIASAMSVPAVNGNEPVKNYVSAAQIDALSLYQELSARAEIGKFGISIGCTDAKMALDPPVCFQLDLNDQSFETCSAIGGKPKTVSADFLSKIWNINHDQAHKCLKQNTQLYRRGGHNDLSRHFSTNDRMLRYSRIDSQFYTDTFFVDKDASSTRGNKCAQLFVSDKGFVAIYPMKNKGEFYDALHMFCKEIGVPTSLVVDPSGEQTSRKVKHFCNQVGTTLRILEAATQWADRAELYVGLFKESTRKDLRVSNSPMVLWDYCLERRARIHNVTPRDLFQLNGNTPVAATFGKQGDISNICQFGWYDWCYYRDDGVMAYPNQKEKLGRILGPTKNEGNEMVQAVLNSKGIVVPRRTVRRLTVAEMNSNSEQKKRDMFDAFIRSKLGDSISMPPDTPEPSDNDVFDLVADDDEELAIVSDDDPIDNDGVAVNDKPLSDVLIHAEVLLPHGEELQHAKVKKRSKNLNGDVVGEYHENPLLNSILYDVEFPDGAVKQYAANIIAENMYAQVDSNGHHEYSLDAIIEHSSDGAAIKKEDKYIFTKSG